MQETKKCPKSHFLYRKLNGFAVSRFEKLYVVVRRPEAFLHLDPTFKAKIADVAIWGLTIAGTWLTPKMSTSGFRETDWHLVSGSVA